MFRRAEQGMPYPALNVRLGPKRICHEASRMPDVPRVMP